MLDGPRAKVERANELIGQLLEEIRVWLTPPAIRKARPHDRRIEWWLQPTPVPPLRFSVLAGEIVHNLRSALDHTAWTLAGVHATKDTYFPVTTTTGDWQREMKTKLKGVPSAAAAVIEGYQPIAEANPLMLVLKTFSNRDKHQVLAAQQCMNRLHFSRTRIRAQAPPLTLFAYTYPEKSITGGDLVHAVDVLNAPILVGFDAEVKIEKWSATVKFLAGDVEIEAEDFQALAGVVSAVLDDLEPHT